MWNLLKSELILFSDKFKKLELKTVTIFLSSTILLTISWYFSNPKFFSSIFNFHKSFELVYEDLTVFCAWFVTDTILFFLIPILIIKFVFKEQLKNYGLILGDWKVGLTISLVSILTFLPIIYFASKAANFSGYFPLMESATDDLVVFLVYETLFFVFIFSWEFIFRGFMLFGLEKKFGLYAVFIQMIPFVLLHNGKPFIESFMAIFGGLFLGYLALRTRSIFYGFLIHAFILIILDVLAFIR